MRRLRGSVSLALSAMLLCLNVEAASLHVHGQGSRDDHDRHAPAFHHHDVRSPAVPAGTHVEPDDRDDAVVPVVLANCTATPIQDAPAITGRIVTLLADSTSPGTCCVPTARAHSPPPDRSTSPRAPPRSSRL